MNKIMSYSFLRFDALKGQQIIAQGSALGLGASREIVRAMTFIKVKFMYRTKMMVSYFPKMRFCNSLPAAGWRPKGIIFFVHRIPPACGRQGVRFFPASLSQGAALG